MLVAAFRARMIATLTHMVLLAPLLAAGPVRSASASAYGSLQVGAHVAPQPCSITLGRGPNPSVVEDCSVQQDTAVAAALRQPRVVRGFGGAAGPQAKHLTVVIVY
jgi:type 1 fimbria pilin